MFSIILALLLQSAPTPVRVYLGPVPSKSGLVLPLPKEFADSYADLKKAHAKAKVPAFTLVEDVAQADLIVTLVQRTEMPTGTTTATAVNWGHGVTSGQSSAQTEPVLVLHVTVQASGDTFDLMQQDLMPWGKLAEKLYGDLASWTTTNHDRLLTLRTP